MALEMDKVMEMSLDEYIDNAKRSKPVNSGVCNESFKAERRKYNGEDEDDEEDAAEEELGIWKGPSSTTNFLELSTYEKNDFDQMFDDLDPKQNQQRQQRVEMQNGGGGRGGGGGGDGGNSGGRFDLRGRILGGGVPPVQSQQWRLMHPNVGNQRPAGMPPLVPQDGPVGNRRQDYNNNINRRQRWRNRDNNNYSNGGNRGYNNNNNNYHRYNGGGGYYNNGRIQRNNQQQKSNCNSQILNQSLKSVLEKLNTSNYPTAAPMQQVTIEVPSESLDIRPGPPTNFNYGRSMPIGAAVGGGGGAPITPAAMAARNLENNATMKMNGGSAAGVDGIKALLGIGQNISNEMMPMLASKFLDMFQNCKQQTVHKPMYDMKLQREIHDIQQKSLMYSCPGGEVVSSDGSGINNCEIIPRTSGVSMNYRFA